MEKKRLRTKADVGKNDGGMEEEPDDIITRRDHLNHHGPLDYTSRVSTKRS